MDVQPRGGGVARTVSGRGGPADSIILRSRPVVVAGVARAGGRSQGTADRSPFLSRRDGDGETASRTTGHADGRAGQYVSLHLVGVSPDFLSVLPAGDGGVAASVPVGRIRAAVGASDYSRHRNDHLRVFLLWQHNLGDSSHPLSHHGFWLSAGNVVEKLPSTPPGGRYGTLPFLWLRSPCHTPKMPGMRRRTSGGAAMTQPPAAISDAADERGAPDGPQPLRSRL